jgi:hypothetical protein
MLDCYRFSHHCTNTTGTGQPHEGHQQVAEQREHQFHSERNFNPLLTVSKYLLRHPFCQNQEFATHWFGSVVFGRSTSAYRQPRRTF